MQFLDGMVDQLPKAEKTLNQLNLGFRKVYTVNESQTAYQAFKTMIDNKVSGVGVVDNEGTLVANISLSDIKVSPLTLHFTSLNLFDSSWVGICSTGTCWDSAF